MNNSNFPLGIPDYMWPGDLEAIQRIADEVEKSNQIAMDKGMMAVKVCGEGNVTDNEKNEQKLVRKYEKWAKYDENRYKSAENGLINIEYDWN